MNDDEWMLPPSLPKSPIPGRRATLCIGGCMDGQYVYAGIATQFFRKVSRPYAPGTRGYAPDYPIDSYRLTQQRNGCDLFVLEPQSQGDTAP